MDKPTNSDQKSGSRSRNHWIAALGAALVVLAGVGGYLATHRNQRESVRDSRLRVAPDFELKDARGKSHRLTDLKGNVVLLHFWASWCPPCLGEIPVWVEIANEFKGKPLKLVAVSLDEGWDAAHHVLPSEKLPGGIISLLDPKSKVSDQYGSYAFPETYLINAQGQIVTKWVGPQDWKSPQFAMLMNEMLSQAGK